MKAKNTMRAADLPRDLPWTCQILADKDGAKFVRVGIRCPAAKKNRPEIHWVPQTRGKKGKRPIVAPSTEARIDERRLAAMFDLALVGHTNDALFGEDDVEVTGSYNAARDFLWIDFRRRAPPPARLCWRNRDLTNFLETILDAAQAKKHRGVFKNDKQVAAIDFRRLYLE